MSNADSAMWNNSCDMMMMDMTCWTAVWNQYASDMQMAQANYNTAVNNAATTFSGIESGAWTTWVSDEQTAWDQYELDIADAASIATQAEIDALATWQGLADTAEAVWNTAATTADAVYQVAATAADTAWTTAERDASATRSTAETTAQAVYDQAERDASAVWDAAEAAATLTYDAAVLVADNAFATENTAAQLQYDQAVADADSDWGIAQADARADYDLAVQAADDAWVIAEAAANTAYENSIAVATTIWVASEAAARGMMEFNIAFARTIAEGAMAVANASLTMSLDSALLTATNEMNAAQTALESGPAAFDSLRAISGVTSVPDTTLGQSAEVAKQFVLGWYQGVLNTVNGVQDIAVGAVNLSISTSMVGVLTDEPQLESPDWSRGGLVHESDAVHGRSKFIGGQSAVTLMAAIPALSLPTLTPGVGWYPRFHVSYRVGATWFDGGTGVLTSVARPHIVLGMRFTLPAVPIVNPAAASSTFYAGSCARAAGLAFLRGWNIFL
ncbi:MAG TPA: hypothetical protein P5307_01150 [Pirellulaceae bacterium]|nr:hypothetical protein [Pirellulaceae bacterium]